MTRLEWRRRIYTALATTLENWRDSGCMPPELSEFGCGDDAAEDRARDVMADVAHELWTRASEKATGVIISGTAAEIGPRSGNTDGAVPAETGDEKDAAEADAAELSRLQGEMN